MSDAAGPTDNPVGGMPVLRTVQVCPKSVDLRMPAVPVSSTKLRAALSRGDPASELLAPAVLQYIQQHHLYSGDY